MNFRAIINLLVCFSLIFVLFASASLAYANLNTENNSEENVITASDAGGGDLSNKELFKIALFIAAFILIFMFALMMLAS